MRAAQANRPLIRMTAFGALALYGTLRWATLTPGQGLQRLLALLALAAIVTVVGPLAARRSRSLPVLLVVVAVLTALALAGIPIRWITHVRVAATSQSIGNGLAAIPGALTPYLGSDHWLLIVITLGAAVLLLDGAIVMAFAPSQLGGLRRAVAALPLIALVAIPATLVKSNVPYLEGLALFALLALFMWGERIHRDRVAAATLICAVAGVAALALAPGLGASRPWLNYQDWASSLSPGAGAESFDWAQRYGPIDWPRTGRPVLEVSATRADYWKAEDLDGFDGYEWTQAVIGGAQTLPPPSSAALDRFSQRITVSIRGMTTTAVIGAGTVTLLTHLPKPVVPGAAPGTWTATGPLQPGASYQAVVYSPHPRPAELERAGMDYTGVPSGYRTLELPGRGFSRVGGGQVPASSQIAFAPFHSGRAPQVVAGVQPGTAEQIVNASPYAGAFSLAQRLAAQSATPYEFVESVMGWLGHGYSYNENPPIRSYPLESFLFVDRRGYCQQFAGAMALLLRMGGIPARVAVGFTPGTYDPSTRTWVVSDFDAHAWVEAWFPSYGWVRFDPTPSADPALAQSGSSQPASSGGASPRPARAKPDRTATPSHRPGASAGGGRPAPTAGGMGVGLVAGLASLALLVGLLTFITRPARGPEAQLAELERAFRRTRRPLPTGVTLAELEHRLRGSPAAATYVRRLRLARFGAGGRAPSRTQRRALRAQLAAGLGFSGRLRAFWALPPKRGSQP